jgi:hypothetical protein
LEGATQPVAIEIRPHWSQVAAPVVGAITALAAVGALLFTSQQVRLAQQGQITDRFTKAVEQLGQAGPEKVDVRLGAIYSLERIMRDSTDDHPAVVEILAAFIRVHAPRAGRPATGAKPPIDVQTALTVLGRRNEANDIPRRYVDLSETNLAGADLWSLDFPDANLSGANLSGAFLDRGYYRGAVLTSANLRNAEVAAYLDGASLHRADLRGADLSGAVEMSSDQVRCAFVDGATELPSHVERPMPDAPLKDPSCRDDVD